MEQISGKTRESKKRVESKRSLIEESNENEKGRRRTRKRGLRAELNARVEQSKTGKLKSSGGNRSHGN